MTERDDVRELPVPERLGTVVDLAPVGAQPTWLALGEDGTISRWDLATGDHETLAATPGVSEADHESWGGYECRRRLHASADGAFAAVVNDFGRYGEVIDLGTGQVTIVLDNQGDDEETVPFSLAFAEHKGRRVVVHRTKSNRLDVSDARTGALLTERAGVGPGDEHELDYYHGALYVSPDGKRIVDDGWVWHPVGLPSVWEIGRWLDGHVWESEDGPSRFLLCDRTDYWNHAMTWIGPDRVAVAGLAEDVMRPWARILDTGRIAEREGWQLKMAVELLAFEGPAGRFFSDGSRLFSSDDTGLSTWDPVDGSLLSTVPGFSPTHHHGGAGQLLQLDGGLVRLLQT